MCFYILQVAICGCHAPKLIVGPSCQAILQQLNRIHAPEAWNSPENPNAESAVPFEFPDSCEPSERNTVTVRMWCGWECRNSYDPTGVIESMGGQRNPAGRYENRVGLGMIGATYGQPRLGIGWRE